MVSIIIRAWCVLIVVKCRFFFAPSIYRKSLSAILPILILDTQYLRDLQRLNINTRTQHIQVFVKLNQLVGYDCLHCAEVALMHCHIQKIFFKEWKEIAQRIFCEYCRWQYTFPCRYVDLG